MGNIIPYFYYDIVARMIPGTATLYVIALVGVPLPNAVACLFTGSDTWKGIAATLLLGGAAYAIGVFYESLFSFPVFSHYKECALKKAIEHAINRYYWKDEALREKARNDDTFVHRAWEDLVVLGSRESDMKSLFALCHRFQAESKMCQHLLVPTLLYASIAVYWRSPIRVVPAAFAFFLLIFASYWRDERRWLQVLSFGERLRCLPGMAGETRSHEATPKPPAAQD